MAAAAVATGPRIRILAALAGTVGPTVELITEEAPRIRLTGTTVYIGRTGCRAAMIWSAHSSRLNAEVSSPRS
jgi:hypothetical protein